MKKSFRKVLSVILTAICMMSIFSVPVLALDYTGYAEDTESTPYGDLTGEFKLFDDSPDGYDFYIKGEVDSNDTFNRMFAEYEIVDYYSGDTLAEDSKTVRNDNFVQINDWWSDLDVPVTIYGCVEVRHTQTYTARPTLYGTYGGI